MSFVLDEKIKLDPNELETDKGKTTPDKLSLIPTKEDIPFSRGFLFSGDQTQQTLINYTGELGSCENIWTGCLFGWGKPNHFRIYKESENFHAVNGRQDNPFYQNTIAEKQRLEQEINTILPHLEREHTDIELIKHDLRRAEELRMMFDDADEAGLKMMFVDQIDFYSGGGGQGQSGRLSMATMRNGNIMPTIVEDFISMDCIEDLDKDGKLSGLPQVEKNMLRVKWRAYERWKELFGNGIESRHKMAETLMKNKEHMLKERKKWLYPRVSRLKMMDDLLEEDPGGFSKDWAERKGEMRSFHNTSIVIYKEYNIAQVNFPLQEIGQYANNAPMYDWFIQENYIYNAKDGLVAKYPWITEEWIEKKVAELKNKGAPQDPIAGGKELLTSRIHFPIKEDYMYYFLFTIKFDKSIFNSRQPDGKENPLEDGEWDIKNFVLTKNFLLVVLLDQEAKKEVFNRELHKFVFKHDDYFSIQYFMDVYGNMTILPKKFIMKEGRKQTALKSLNSSKKKLEKTLKDNQKDEKTKQKLDETNLLIELITGDLIQKEKTYPLIYGKGAKYFEYDKKDKKDDDKKHDGKRKTLFSKEKKIVQKIFKFAGVHYDDKMILFQRVSKKNVENPEKKHKSPLESTNEFLKNFGLVLASDRPFRDPVLDHMTWPNGPY
ncbi:MAG: hypothetical protein KAJ47_02475, partial [Candidatus Aenigmarchaeota archaeon]|nr:hypothetical protein [Candidatus Aenigmarchaeota archaeon]